MVLSVIDWGIVIFVVLLMFMAIMDMQNAV